MGWLVTVADGIANLCLVLRHKRYDG